MEQKENLEGKQGQPSEAEQEQAEAREAELQKFIQEIAGIRSADEARGWHPSHFSEINPAELTYDDMLIYRLARKMTLTESELEEYEDKIIDPETRELRKGVPQSRLEFLAFINNLAVVIFHKRRQEEKMKRAKEK